LKESYAWEKRRMDVVDKSMTNLAAQLRREKRKSTTGAVFYTILKCLTILLAALIAPMALLTKKPIVPAMMGTAIVIIEGLQLVFRFHDQWLLSRPRVEELQKQRMGSI